MFDYKKLAGLVLSLVLLTNQAVWAQEVTSEQADLLPLVPPSLSPGPAANTPGAVSCFDYYNFNSIQVDVAPQLESAYTTDPLRFVGNITNNNSYPVVDGQIWMKVFKLEQASDEFLKENGYPLVEFVLIKDGINLNKNEVEPLEFEWTIPTYLAEGNYQSAFFFTTAHRYNLLGLSFTDDVVGNTTSFEVKSANPYTPVTFDKNSVRVNDTPTSFALPPRHFEQTLAATAYATLVNDADEERRLELAWTTYKWDGIRSDFVKDVKKETVQIPPKDSLEVSYEAPILDSAVTFIQAEVIDGDAKSMLHIRYVRDGVAETRINFPSIFTYPLVAGEEATIFSCVHSTNLPVVNDNTLTLTLKDVNNNILHSYTYQGDITGDMMGLKDVFVPEKSYGSFSLTASLTRAGELVEEVTINYNCEDLDPGLCTEADRKANTDDSNPAGLLDDQLRLAVLLVLLLFIVAGLLYYKYNIKGTPPREQTVTDDLGNINKQ